MTNMYLLQQNIVMTKVCFSQQTEKFCHAKHTFVMTKDVFCHNKQQKHTTKIILVAAPANDNVKLPPFFPSAVEGDHCGLTL